MIPEKCMTCEHTVMQFEEVHKGWCKFQLEEVVRCDLSGHIVGCVCANVYCDRKESEGKNGRHRVSN